MTVYKLRIEESDNEDLGDEFRGPVIVYPRRLRRSYHDPATRGLIIAHDIIEHHPRPSKCGFVDELMAIGSMLAGRVATGFVGRSMILPLSNETVEGDIMTLLSYDYEGATTAPGPRGAASRLKDAFDMDTVRLLKRFEEEHEWDAGRFNADFIAANILRGAAMYKRRFSGMDIYSICELFDQIMRRVDVWMRCAELGDEAELSVVFRQYYADLKPVDPAH